MSHLLANHLVNHALLSSKDAERALFEAKQQSILLVSFLVQHNLVTSQQLLESCAKAFGLNTFNLKDYQSDWLDNMLFPPEIMRQYHVIPLNLQQTILHVGISDPTDRGAIEIIAFHTGLSVLPVLVLEDQLTDFIENYFSKQTTPHLNVTLLKNISPQEKPTLPSDPLLNDEPIIQFVDHLIQHALHQRASDIHLEPFEFFSRIRYRQDGILHDIAEFPPHLMIRLVTRLKVLAKLDISERRLPQDGRFQLHGHDIRFNACPTLFGEKVVLRLLNANKLQLSLEALQFSATQQTLFLESIAKPQGLILVTGPTGSGKTTTLYTALNLLNTADKNILTLEDPVEMQLLGLNQVNIQPKLGLNFATTLRTLLRQDPDIIMVGEIRDPETAEIAMQAAETGHLVFSTLHTKSAAESLTRLQSMGIPDYHLRHTLSLVIAQRLLRKLCLKCREIDDLQSATPFYKAKGCEHCVQGYQGRIPIYEFLISTDLSPSPDLSLKAAGFKKLSQGLTSHAELNRVLSL